MAEASGPMRLLPGFALTIAAIAGAFLLSPRPSHPVTCADDIRITRFLGFPLNCDSRVFAGLAQRPDALFDGGGAGRTWQSRPLFIAAGALARSWWKTALDLAGRHPVLDGIDVPAWLGYVLINFLLLAGALAAFATILRPWVLPPALVLVLATFFVANRVVKSFFWTPHTQIFNVLVPVLGIAWAARALGREERRDGAAVTEMLLLGGLSLAYGSFLAVGTVIAAIHARRPGARSRAARFAAGMSLLAAPPLAWIACLRLGTGSFYSYETGFYHEFVWLPEALRPGGPGLFAAVAGHAARFAGVAAPVVLVPAAALALVSMAARARGARLSDLGAEAGRALEACGWILAANVAFFGLLGYYADRLAWNCAAPLIVAAIVIGAEMRRLGLLSDSLFRAAASVAALSNAVYWILRPSA